MRLEACERDEGDDSGPLSAGKSRLVRGLYRGYAKSLKKFFKKAVFKLAIFAELWYIIGCVCVMRRYRDFADGYYDLTLWAKSGIIIQICRLSEPFIL